MEDIINQIDGQVQIIFNKSQDGLTFCDAIWLTQTEYDSMSAADIETIKQTRFDDWLAVLNPSTTPEESTPESIPESPTPEPTI